MSIKSMTGFGLAEGRTPSGTYNVEIRGVNNRYLEIQLRQPRFFANLEQKIKKDIGDTISRGSISVFITSDRESGQSKITCDNDRVAQYLSISSDIKKKHRLAGDITLSDLLHFSDVISTTTATFDEKTLWKHFSPILAAALEHFQKSRAAEGALLAKDIKKNLDAMLAMLKKIETQAPLRVKQFSTDLAKRIEKLTAQFNQNPDAQRLATEIALMADRLDIAEECMRLRAHITAFSRDCSASEPVGKRMNFLVQEMNREANTIGSKANDTGIAHLSVTLKESIEKIREQIQNIE